MAQHVIHRGTHGLWETAIIERRGIRIVSNDKVMHQEIQGVSSDPRFDMFTNEIASFSRLRPAQVQQMIVQYGEKWKIEKKDG